MFNPWTVRFKRAQLVFAELSQNCLGRARLQETLPPFECFEQDTLVGGLAGVALRKWQHCAGNFFFVQPPFHIYLRHNSCFKKCRPVETTHTLEVCHHEKEAFPHDLALRTIIIQKRKFASFLEAKAMTTKLAVHQLRKTTQKTLLPVHVINGASTWMTSPWSVLTNAWYGIQYNIAWQLDKASRTELLLFFY